jgi:asparagine synthetase B (glutamine-hydrolysing)
MSGIAGVLKKSENNYDIHETLKIIRHRGPDQIKSAILPLSTLWNGI